MKKLLAITIAATALAAWTVQAEDAKATWDSQCAKCHGKEGKGETKMGQKLGAKDYSTAKVQEEMKDDAAFKGIKEGVKDKDGKTIMKAFDTLSDAEIKALVAHMRTFKK